jgi:hypothetical protein
MWKCERNKKQSNHSNAILFIILILHAGKNEVFFFFSLFLLCTHLLFHLFYMKWMCQRFFFLVYIFHLKLTRITNEKSNKSKITNFMRSFFFLVFIYSTLLLASLQSTSIKKKKKKHAIYVDFTRSCFFRLFEGLLFI